MDEQGHKHIIRKRVPVFGDFNNKFAQRKSQLNQSLRDCVEAYQSAADEADRHVLQAKIETQLGELFDLQQQEREAQLKPMEDGSRSCETRSTNGPRCATT